MAHPEGVNDHRQGNYITLICAEQNLYKADGRMQEPSSRITEFREECESSWEAIQLRDDVYRILVPTLACRELTKGI